MNPRICASVYTAGITRGTMSAPSITETRQAVAPESRQAVAWYVWCSVAAVTFSMVGVHWDISWHRSIGRDTFWTPAASFWAKAATT